MLVTCSFVKCPEIAFVSEKLRAFLVKAVMGRKRCRSDNQAT